MDKKLIEKLKVMVGKEIADRKVYIEAGEVLDRLGELSGLEANLEGRIKSLGEQEAVARERAELAQVEANDAVIKSANRVSEAEADHVERVKELNAEYEGIIADHNAQVKELQAKQSKLVKLIKEREADLSEAESGVLEAQVKLENIRSQAKSI